MPISSSGVVDDFFLDDAGPALVRKDGAIARVLLFLVSWSRGCLRQPGALERGPVHMLLCGEG